MHVIKRGERLKRERRVVGSGQGDAAAAAGAVGRTRPPPPLPALPAAASRLGLLASLCFPSPSPALQSAPLSPCHRATFQKSNTSSLSSSSCVRRALPRQYFIHEEPLRYDYQLLSADEESETHRAVW